MNLTRVSDSQLHILMKTSVAEEKIATVRVLRHLQEVHRRKLFIVQGYSTLMKYMVHELGYSDFESWTRIQAMKLIVDVPEVEIRIEQGQMSLSNAATLKEVLSRSENKEEVLLMGLINAEAPTRTFRKLMDPEIREKRIVLSERILFKLEKISDRPELEIIESLIDEKLKFLEVTRSIRTSKKPCSNTRYVPVSVKREIYARAGYQCEFRNKRGERCPERRNLQYDHIKPFSLGGENSKENLRLYCSGHNQRRNHEAI